MTEISEINLDKIVSELRKSARSSSNEEELKINVTKVINENIASPFNLTMGRYEYTLVSGARVDALYGHVLIEYKAPGVLSTSSGFKKAQKQIIDYIISEAGVKERFKLFFGIIISDKIAFIKFNTLTDDWSSRGPYEINKEVILKVVEAFRGLRRKRLCAEELLRDFGPKSELALNAINTLYEKLDNTENQKILLLLEDWVRIFSQITGYNEEDLKGLDDYYETHGKDYTKLLFCIHTYYALLMKIIAAELAYLYGTGRYLRSYVDELEDKFARGLDEFKKSLKDLEEGGIFKRLLKIRNFIEGGYFSWYLEEFDEEIKGFIAEIARRLSEYEPATPVLEPEETKDMLKIIYQKLVPRPIRHNLGEYYTPDWLAQFLLDKVDFSNRYFEQYTEEYDDPTKPLELRVLDPACGSGTFLIEALKRIRIYAENHYVTDIMSEYVLKNIVGIDLNPLAVLAARTNYLLNIGDLLTYTNDVELPIFLADSITIRKKRAVYGSVYKIETSAGEFRIPSSIIDEQKDLGSVLDKIAESVLLNDSSEEFKRRLKETTLYLTDSEIEGLYNGLYNLLLKLEKEGKDHIWVTILLNAFAPLFIGKFDYVVGNPPWILWDNLPDDYRNNSQDLWKNYGLFTLTASQAMHGGGKKDLAILFTYACIDKYLKEKGKFGFLITQSVFKTKGAGEGFRRFKLNNTYLKVKEAHDFVEILPFEGANNRTAAILIEKNEQTDYPVPYIVWQKLFDIDQKESLESASKKLHSTEMAAIPSDPDNELSPWITVPLDTVNIVQKVYGKNAYPVYEGINSGGANGVYWITIHEIIDKKIKEIDISKSLSDVLGISNQIEIKEIFIENVIKGMKKKVDKVETIIEDFFVYPMIKSKNVKKWRIDGYNYALQMQDPIKRIGYNEGWVKLNFPKTYAYLFSFKEILENRAAYKRFMEHRKQAPFFSIYNVGKYTYAPYKVVWNRMGSKITACVISTIHDKFLGEKLILPDNVLAYIPVTDECEAHYICALMNSSVTDMILRSIAGGTKSFGTPKIIEDTIKIPHYDSKNELHQKLAQLSRRAHESAEKGLDLITIEEEIDNMVSELWGITENDLTTVKKTISIQEGEIIEDEPEVEPEIKKNIEILFPNLAILPELEQEIEIILNNPLMDSLTLIIEFLGKKIKFTANERENIYKIRLDPLKEGEYEIKYILICTEKEIEGIETIKVKSIPKHRKSRFSNGFDELLGE